MTGLSAHNLRKWEERYGAVKPHRTGSGERLYNRENVRRLLLIKKLSKAGVPIGEVAKATLADLERISQETVSDALPRRFSSDSVARIISMSPSIECECPHHLAQIVMSLSAFEQYSAECESSSPDDVELHRYLKGVAGRSRAAFEEALARVVEAEGIFLNN